MQENILINRKLGDNLYDFFNNASPLNEIENIPSKSGVLTMKFKDNFIHSSYNPENEAEKFGHSKIDGKKIIFVLGLGLGYHVKKLIQKTDAIIVLIELNPGIFKNAYQNIDLSFLRKVIFYPGKIEDLYNFLMQILPEEKCNAVEILPLASIVKLFQKEYEQVADIINKVISQKLQSFITTLGFGERWIKNILRNAATIQNPFTIRNKTHSPVFILASGPTLEDALPHIESMKQKGIVLCLSHSLFALVKNNVYPDAVFAIDGGFAARNHFSLLPDKVFEKTLLITTLSAYPDIIKYWKGKICIININLPLEKDLYPDSLTLPVAGTVSATAFLFALWLSPGPYYFAGLDLAYTKNKYHHKNSLSEEKILLDSNKFSTAETVLYNLMEKLNPVLIKNPKGEIIKTNRAMNAYHEWFDNAFNKKNVFIFGNDGAFFTNAKNIEYNELNKLKNINEELIIDNIFINKNNAIKRFEKISAQIEKDVFNSNDDAIIMQFSRYKSNQEGLNFALKKAKKLYNKSINLMR